MKNTIKINAGLAFSVENKATQVRLDLETSFMSKGIDIDAERAYALADALVIAAQAIEKATAGADLQRLVNRAEGLVR